MKRIATQTVILHREGKRVVIKPNQMFDFTTAEIKEIEGTSKDALRKALNEEAEIVEVKVPAARVADVNAAIATGGIVNQDDSAANPDASVPAPNGKATSPTTGKGNPKPAAKDGNDEL
jgi:hypothetical protein